jgi:hypothetical protein
MHDAADEFAELRTPRHIKREWVAVLVPPLAWMLGLVAKYALVPFVCGSGDTIWLHLVSIVTLLAALGASALSWRLYQRTGEEWPDDRIHTLDRGRFMAAMGMLSGALFGIAIIAQWLTSAFLNPCMSI